MKISKNTNKNYNKLINIFGNEFTTNGGTFYTIKKNPNASSSQFQL